MYLPNYTNHKSFDIIYLVWEKYPVLGTNFGQWWVLLSEGPNHYWDRNMILN